MATQKSQMSAESHGIDINPKFDHLSVCCPFKLQP